MPVDPTPSPAPQSVGEELKPCPFCGSDDLHAFEHSEGEESYGFQCARCWMTSSQHTTKVEAINAWNRRTDPSESAREKDQARIAELEGELAKCGGDNCMGQDVEGCRRWVSAETIEAAEARATKAESRVSELEAEVEALGAATDSAEANQAIWVEIAEERLARATLAEGRLEGAVKVMEPFAALADQRITISWVGEGRVKYRVDTQHFRAVAAFLASLKEETGSSQGSPAASLASELTDQDRPASLEGEALAALKDLCALFDDYRESDLSHSDAHNILVRYPIWERAKAVLAAASGQHERKPAPGPVDASDICAHDDKPCYVGADTDDAHWRCGTSSCRHPSPLSDGGEG